VLAVLAVLEQLHLFLEHLLAMLVVVEAVLDKVAELQHKAVVLAHQEVALLELLELQILVVAVVVEEEMAVKAVQA
jgi:hypothetical protein